MTKPETALLEELVMHGGAIVSSNGCSGLEIALARAEGRLFVSADGLGFVRRTNEWLMLQRARENQSEHETATKK